MSKSWKGEVSSWDNICQVESSKSSDPEPDSSSVKVLGHSLAKWSYSLHLKHLSLSQFVLTWEPDLDLVVDLLSLFLSLDSVLDLCPSSLLLDLSLFLL